MGRKRSSTAEDFVGLVSMLPWWGALALAAAFYLLFHSFSSPPVAGAVQPAKAGSLMQSALIYGVANISQYLVPGLCLIAAVISFLGRRKRRQLVKDVATSSAAKPLDGMSWREFEMLVGEAFRQDGYSVLETGGGGADGGVDLVLRKAGATYLVQCKQWKAFTVPVGVVRELYGVMSHHKAAGGFVVTSGRFTADAAAFAAGKNIRLLNGVKLVEKIRSKIPAARVTDANPADPVASDEAAPPVCPICAAAMVRRTAMKGAKAGNQFWGCSRYPQCRGVR